MADQELVTVHEGADPTKAELIRMALENEGIQCFIDGLGSAIGGIPTLGIKVQVPASEAQRARKFLERHETKS